MRDEDEEGVSTDEEDPNFHEYSPAGRGILVFSPEKAGQDVTPANYTFPENSKEKRHSTTLTSIAGTYKCALMNFIITHVSLDFKIFLGSNKRAP